MRENRRQNVLHGAFILIVAAVVVKVIGAFFKIPLTGILGGTGMGYFMTAYSLFNPIHALAVAGMPVAVSKLVSENMAKGRYRDARRVFRISCVLFIVTGVIGFLIMAVGGSAFAKLVGNPQAYWALLVMAPAVLFGCVMSAFRGYYEGMRNMYPTAISQVVEAVVKLLTGILLANYILELGLTQYVETGMVFGQVANNLQHANELTLPYAAAGAIGGITLSTLAGAIFMVLRYVVRGDGMDRQKLASSPYPHGRRQIARDIIAIAVPVCASAAVVNLSGVIDLFSIMNRLDVALARDSYEILAMYGSHIPRDMDLAQIPNYLYGSYTGLAVTVYHLVPAITAAFGVSALPAVSASWSTRNLEKTRVNIESILRVTAMISIPAGLGIAVLSEPILALLYSARPDEVAIAAPLLQVLGIAVIFVAIATPVNSMLQGVGRVDLPVKLMLIGGLMKLGCNYIFVAMPGVNIQAAPYGTLACYLFIVTVSIFVLCRTTGISIGLFKVFGKPFLAGLACALAAHTAYGFFGRMGLGHAGTLLAVAIGGGIYGIFLLLLKTLTREDVMMLPMGEKVAKILEKFSLLG